MAFKDKKDGTGPVYQTLNSKPSPEQLARSMCKTINRASKQGATEKGRQHGRYGSKAGNTKGLGYGMHRQHNNT